MDQNLKKYIALIKGKQWYHQGFDGSPMFLFAVGEAETKQDKRRPRGTEAVVRVCFFNQGRGNWYLDMEDIQRGVNSMIKLAKKDPNLSAKLLKAWRQDEQKFENFFWHEFPKINLKKLTNTRLLNLWQKYSNLFINRFTSSCIIDHFALGTDELVGNMIREELKGKIKTESDFVKIFSIVTAPVKQSFINEAEIELLKVATDKSNKSLAAYQKKYFWIKNNYVRWKVLSTKDFENEIRQRKAEDINLTKELRHLQNTPGNNLKEKNKIIKKYNFSPLLRTMLKISEDFSWWQDERKKSTFLNMHLGASMLSEVSRRTGYQLEELKYAIRPEIAEILNQREPGRKELVARQKQSVFIMTRKGYAVATGKEAQDIRKLMLGKKIQNKIKDFRGLSASLGRAVGKVKIVKSSMEIGKVNKGDILVAVMTRPDYVPAMKKAAAIVTNEGGITSHAAIVSRELRIPCIIGTKIATDVLKDGDVVEVDADHGVVKKLK